MAEEKELTILAEREALLDREIAERQKLKEAYRLVHEDLARVHKNGAVDDEHAPSFPFVPEQDDPREIAPDGKQYGENTRLVRLAISKMSDDYTIRDIHSYLRTHGYELGMNRIATVLNRLKKNGDIKIRVAGIGRRPTLFRKGHT